MDFDTTKFTYKDKVEDAVSFSGKGLDYYTKVKASFVSKVVKRHLPNVSKPRILDVGCGHGYIHSFLKEHAWEITGVETAAEVLALAKQENPENAYIAYDGRSLPFANESFDVALAVCVMHHVPPEQWSGFISEAKRVLRPGGQVLIFEHNPLNPLTRYVVATNEIDADAVLLSHSKLSELLVKGGFCGVYARSILFTPFDGRFFHKLDEKLGWLPFGAQYYATGSVPLTA
jgi:SAM-dependent methyltransferase